MKRTMKKMLSFGLVAAMSLTMLAGCGNSKDATNDTNVSNGQEEKKPTGDVKIGVLVQDVSGEEALGFRSQASGPVPVSQMHKLLPHQRYLYLQSQQNPDIPSPGAPRFPA